MYEVDASQRLPAPGPRGPAMAGGAITLVPCPGAKPGVERIGRCHCYFGIPARLTFVQLREFLPNRTIPASQFRIGASFPGRRHLRRSTLLPPRQILPPPLTET